jgi:prophage DNA circulation protein
MKSFLRSSVMSLLGMALAFSSLCAGIVQVARQRVAETIRLVKDTFKYVVDRMLAKLHTGRLLNAPAVLLIASKAFVLRKIRREAPRIENSWRMCPST